MRPIIGLIVSAILVSANRSTRFGDAKDLGKQAFDAGSWETALGEFMKALDVRDDAEIRRWADVCREKLEGIRAHRRTGRPVETRSSPLPSEYA